MTIVTAAPMRAKIRKVRDAALTYAIVSPPEATRRIPITVSCPNFTGFPQSRVSGQSGRHGCTHLPSRGKISTITRADHSPAALTDFDAAEGETVAFRCTGKRPLPIFLASFVVPGLALKLVRD